MKKFISILINIFIIAYSVFYLIMLIKAKKNNQEVSILLTVILVIVLACDLIPYFLNRKRNNKTNIKKN